MEFLVIEDFFFFNISFRTGNLQSKQISKIMSTCYVLTLRPGPKIHRKEVTHSNGQ